MTSGNAGTVDEVGDQVILLAYEPITDMPCRRDELAAEMQARIVAWYDDGLPIDAIVQLSDLRRKRLTTTGALAFIPDTPHTNPSIHPDVARVVFSSALRGKRLLA